MSEALVYTDGASKGNPGEASCAYVIKVKDSILKAGFYIGVTTNNVAEYMAVLLALLECKRLGVRVVYLKSDSELLVNQINGAYRVRSTHLLRLYKEVMLNLRSFDKYVVEYIKRSDNKEADFIANQVLRAKAIIKSFGLGGDGLL